MKRHLIMIIVALSAAIPAPLMAGDSTRVKPYFKSDALPNGVLWLPVPPDSMSAGYAYDMHRFLWGKEQRLDADRAAMAKVDADYTPTTMLKVFSAPCGVEMSKEKTPLTYEMLTKLAMTGAEMGHKAKEFYNRKRPFVVFGQPSLVPEHDAALAKNGSYPSGHTIYGWVSALVFIEIFPECADQIALRGLQYAESRVIVAAHWQSDIEAGQKEAAVLYAFLHSDPTFFKELEKVKKELHKAKANEKLTPKN